MPVDPIVWAGQAIGWALSNLAVTLTGVLAIILLAWAAEAYDEAEDRGEALGEFSDRAKSGTGGALNVVLVSLVAVVGWAATTFQTAGEAGVFLLSMAPDMPILAASIVTVGLGALGLSDLIVLRAWHFLAFAVVALGLAAAYRADFRGVQLP